MKKTRLEKQKKKREQKKKEYNIAKVEYKRSAKSGQEQKQVLDRANRVMQIRELEIMGLKVMFKILNGREITDKDKFTPEKIGEMCEDFIKKHSKMNKEDQEEFKPLIPLAMAKVESVKRYKTDKENAKESKEKIDEVFKKNNKEKFA